MIKIKMKVPDEEFGELEKVFEFKDYLSVTDIFEIGFPMELMQTGIKDLQNLDTLKNKIDPKIIIEFQLKLLKRLYIGEDDLGSLPLPVILLITKEPKITKVIQYSFGQGVDFKTDDVVSPEQKKN